jgi:hypothetical protein
MSTAYKQRKKAIARRAWDFAAQVARSRGKLFRPLTAGQRDQEITVGLKPGRMLLHNGHYRQAGRPNSRRLGRRFPKWALRMLAATRKAA